MNCSKIMNRRLGSCNLASRADPPHFNGGAAPGSLSRLVLSWRICCDCRIARWLLSRLWLAKKITLPPNFTGSISNKMELSEEQMIENGTVSPFLLPIPLSVSKPRVFWRRRLYSLLSQPPQPIFLFPLCCVLFASKNRTIKNRLRTVARVAQRRGAHLSSYEPLVASETKVPFSSRYRARVL